MASGRTRGFLAARSRFRDGVRTPYSGRGVDLVIVGGRCRPTSSSDTSPDETANGSMQALARLPRVRKGVVYLDSTYVPSDDSCFSRFEAKSADDVRDVNEIAGVPFARIVAAAEIGVDLQRPVDEGGSS
jgi:hypothetical protein